MTVSGIPDGIKIELIHPAWRTTLRSIKHFIYRVMPGLENQNYSFFFFFFRKEDRGSPGEISPLLTGIRQGHGNNFAILDLTFIALCHS